MKKEFKKLNNELLVTVIDNNKLIIPVDGKATEIGTFEQTIIQHIPEEQIKVLKDFIAKQKDDGEKRLAEMQKELEPIKDVVEIPEDIIAGCTKYIVKGAKEFKKAMNPLSDAINKINKKKQLITQIEFTEKQLKDIVSDYDKLQLI